MDKVRFGTGCLCYLRAYLQTGGERREFVTMRCLTGRIVARLLIGQDPGYLIERFSPDRFSDRA